MATSDDKSQMEGENVALRWNLKIFSIDFKPCLLQYLEAKRLNYLTWAGADIKPTAIPHTTRPMSMAVCEFDSAIIHQPLNNGIMESIRALRRPYVSIIPADASDPMGVAKECIDAMREGDREWENV